MPIIFDTGALVRTALTAAEFTATRWDTGEDKARFANDLCRFIAADFRTTLFTDRMYRRLAMMFGHIAHYDRWGFLGRFFEDLGGKVEFLEQTMSWRPCGDPAWTWSDVERALLTRLHACDLLAAYRSLRAAEVEGAERELLRRLQAKYADGRAPASPPILQGSPAAARTAATRAPAEQSKLF